VGCQPAALAWPCAPDCSCLLAAVAAGLVLQAPCRLSSLPWLGRGTADATIQQSTKQQHELSSIVNYMLNLQRCGHATGASRQPVINMTRHGVPVRASLWRFHELYRQPCYGVESTQGNILKACSRCDRTCAVLSQNKSSVQARSATTNSMPHWLQNGHQKDGIMS